jgi:hypothetical protein
MAFPASVVPSGNSYSVHVAGGDDLLTHAAAAAGALLLPHKVDVRQHVAGDSPEASARRAFLTRAGTKASAFSPAPSPEIPGEGFWKTTLAVVRAAGGDRDFWWPPRADKKVEWECLRVALRAAEDGVEGLPADRLAWPDLWIVQAPEAGPDAAEWIRRGAGAAAVFSPTKVTWASRNAAFGRSAGERGLGAPVPGAFALACGAAGLVAGLFEDLLGDNLFDKSWVRVDRADLEARPLRLSRACATGAAAASASGEDAPERLLHKNGDLAGRVRARLQEARRTEYPEGEPKPWGSKGRK